MERQHPFQNSHTKISGVFFFKKKKLGIRDYYFLKIWYPIK